MTSGASRTFTYPPMVRHFPPRLTSLTRVLRRSPWRGACVSYRERTSRGVASMRRSDPLACHSSPTATPRMSGSPRVLG